MRRADLEIIVGLFIIGGILCLAYLSVKLARSEVMGGQGLQLVAIFPNTGGLKHGAQVEIAGVSIGRVKDISLDNYRARVIISIDPQIKVQDDAIARIKTKGLLGEKYVDIVPGGSDVILQNEGRIQETQPPVDIEELISNFVFGKV